MAAVVADDTTGITEAFSHLRQLGHRYIGHLAGPSDMSTGADRARAFDYCASSAGLSDSCPIVECEQYTARAAPGAMELLLTAAPWCHGDRRRQRPDRPRGDRDPPQLRPALPGRCVRRRLQRHALPRPDDTAVDDGPGVALRPRLRGRPNARRDAPPSGGEPPAGAADATRRPPIHCSASHSSWADPRQRLASGACRPTQVVSQPGHVLVAEAGGDGTAVRRTGWCRPGRAARRADPPARAGARDL